MMHVFVALLNVVVAIIIIVIVVCHKLIWFLLLPAVKIKGANMALGFAVGFGLFSSRRRYLEALLLLLLGFTNVSPTATATFVICTTHMNKRCDRCHRSIHIRWS